MRQRVHAPNNARQRIYLWVPRRREDDSLEGHSSIGTKFAVQDVCYGINDTIRINATAFSDLIDQRVAINQPSREQPDVWDLLFQTDDRNLDVAEAAIEQ